MTITYKCYLTILLPKAWLRFCLNCALILFIQPSLAIEASVSGYARIVSGIMDDSNGRYQGYDDEIAFDQDSLLGLQTQLKITEQLSFTALGVAHSNTDIDSGIEWLYFNYRPYPVTQIKLGKMRTPFYSKSDVLNVGYAYPWVMAPKELYTNYIFDEFQGIDLRYSYFAKNYSTLLEIYYGEFDDEITVNSSQFDAKVDNLQGIIAELRFGGFNYRLSFHKGDANPDLQLESFADSIQLAGFKETAESLKTEGHVEFYQVGIEYDSLDYFLISEWTKIKPSQKLFPEKNSYYLTLGHHFNELTYLVTYSHQKDDLEAQVNDIPNGLSPALDQLSAGYQQIYDNRQQDHIAGWSLGLRWDFRYDTALKAELKNIQTKQDNTSDNESSIMLFGLEWVF